MIEKFGPWGKFGKMLERSANKAASQTERALAKAANRLASDMKKNITDQGATAGKPFRKLKDSTIKRKGSSKALIDTGAMRNSLKAIKRDRFEQFVGIPGEATNDGESIPEYARRLEFGGVNENGVFIEPIPFIGPTVDAKKKERIAEMSAEIKEIFKL